MGTHPIFESDFDCLTDMNRCLARPILRSTRAYRQDMPPPGGYAALPWRRNIPTRGLSFLGTLGFGIVYVYLALFNNTHRYTQWRREMKMEAENLDMACMPLFEAEIDRDELRSLKHLIESEAVNIVASGFDKNWKCGGYGIGNNLSAAYWPSNGFKSPYNAELSKNTIGGDRWAKYFSHAHAGQAINNAMGTGAGKFEHVGPGTRGNTY